MCRWPNCWRRTGRARDRAHGDRGRRRRHRRLEKSGKTVLRYADVVAGESAEFDWPDIDENSAAAMCYTSGTTGNPKGVVYSHRSSYLHTMATCTTNGIGIGASDCVLPIVPMFHANAWGLPYAALMAGADLVLARPPSGRQVAGRHDREAAAHHRRRGADHLERRHALSGEESRPRHLVAAGRALRRIGRAGVADAHLRGTARRPDPPAVGHDGNLADGHHGVAAAGQPPRSSTGRSARARANRSAAWKPGSSTTTGRCCPTTTRPSARWKSVVRGSPLPTTGATTSRNSTTAGCAPATSVASTNAASSR